MSISRHFLFSLRTCQLRFQFRKLGGNFAMKFASTFQCLRNVYNFWSAYFLNNRFHTIVNIQIIKSLHFWNVVLVFFQNGFGNIFNFWRSRKGTVPCFLSQDVNVLNIMHMRIKARQVRVPRVPVKRFCEIMSIFCNAFITLAEFTLRNSMRKPLLNSLLCFFAWKTLHWKEVIKFEVKRQTEFALTKEQQTLQTKWLVQLIACIHKAFLYAFLNHAVVINTFVLEFSCWH